MDGEPKKQYFSEIFTPYLLDLGNDTSAWLSKIHQKVDGVLEHAKEATANNDSWANCLVVELGQYSHALPLIEKSIFEKLVAMRSDNKDFIPITALMMFDPRLSKLVKNVQVDFDGEHSEWVANGETFFEHEYIGHYLHSDDRTQFLVISFYNNQGQLDVDASLFSNELKGTNDHLTTEQAKRNICSLLAPNHPSTSDLEAADNYLYALYQQKAISQDEFEKLQLLINEKKSAREMLIALIDEYKTEVLEESNERN